MLGETFVLLVTLHSTAASSRRGTVYLCSVQSVQAVLTADHAARGKWG